MGAEHETTPKSPADVKTTENEFYSKQQVIYKRGTTPRTATPDCLAQGTGYKKIDDEDDLFYATAVIEGKVELLALVDSGSTTCTLSEPAERILRSGNIIDGQSSQPTEKVLIGCGGNETKPKYTYELNIDLLGCKMTVSFLVVPGQVDDMIVGSNVMRHIMRQVKKSDWFWDNVSQPAREDSHEPLLDLLSNVDRWHGNRIPKRVGTVVLKQCVTLEPRHEHLLWGKLKEEVQVSVGSTVMVEPSVSRSAPRNVLVARTVCPLWGDKWIPMKVINPLDRPIVLRRNTKLAQLHPCLALEELQLDTVSEGSSGKAKAAVQNLIQAETPGSECPQIMQEDYMLKLQELGLAEIDVQSCDVSDVWKAKLVDLISQYEGIFSRDKLDCGEAKDIVHRIRLKDEQPFRLPCRRVPPSDYQKLKQTLDAMEEKGIIRKSNSEWASPLVLVWKPSGELRICTDFRWLNQRTVKDAYPLPHQADALASLGGNCFFSTMDLTSGFYNIPIHEDDRKYTACSTPAGLYEYNRMAQGLCNSPATFARMMTSIFGDQNYLSLLCYLDDLLVFGKSEQEALDRLEMVFSRLKEHNLKLAQKKCYFLRESVKFLGHIVTAEGIATDPEKVSAINQVTAVDLMEGDGETPSPTKIRSFLGMANYYSHFIEGLSGMAKPLFGLTAGQKTKRKNGKPQASKPRRLKPEDWTTDCELAVEKIKRAVTQTAILAHPDFKKPFVLFIDASMDGLGAVLSQIPEGEKRPRPVAFANKTLSKSQSRYPAHRLEFFALKWAVCDKFAHWLKGNQFTVLTDNNPLTYIMTKPKLDACEQRWVSKIAPFDFDLKYIPGTQNIPADLLSRRPFAKVFEASEALEKGAQCLTSECIQEAFRLSVNVQTNASYLSQNQDGDQVGVTGEGVKALLESCSEWENGRPVRDVKFAQCSGSLLQGGVPALPAFSAEDVKRSQKEDCAIARVRFFVERRRRPSRRERNHETAEVLRMLKHWEKLEMSNDILYRRSKDRAGRKRYQLVLPASLKAVALKGTHDDAGHQGQGRTLHLVRQRFFWSGMDGEVKEYVSHCKRCVVSKTLEPEARAPLESIRTSAPLELVCIDFWSAEGKNGENVDVLVITDHFTKLALAFPCPNQTAKVVAQKLWNQFFCTYGFPLRIHSDKGANFESQLIAELLQVSGIKKSHTTPYHPMGNGQTERFNRTLGNMIRSLPARAKERWPQMIQTLTFSYNCTTHETTGFAPFYLMYGRVPRLPVDIMFGNTLKNDDVVAHDTYVESFQRDLREAVKIAQSNTTEAQKKQAREYNKRIKGVPLEVGDHVLLANRKDRGKGKLADLWDSSVHVITWRDLSVHIYRVENPTTKKSKVVHRNFILPVNFLPVVEPEEASTIFSTASEGVADEVETLGNEPLFGTERELGDRTAAWILNGHRPKKSSIREGPDTLEDNLVEVTVTTRLDIEGHQTTPVEEEDMASLDDSRSSGTSNQSIVSGSNVSENHRSESEGDIGDGTSEQEALHEPGDSRSDYSMSVTTPSGISSVTGSAGCSTCITPERHYMPPRGNLSMTQGRSQGAELSETFFRPEGSTTTRAGRVVKPVRRLLESMSMVMGEPASKEPLAALFKALLTLIEV